jgi:hypothetical protein
VINGLTAISDYPPEHALVLTAPCLPIVPTTPARMTHDCVRHGITSLFAAYDTGSGPVIGQSCHRHRHQEFLRLLKVIDTAVLTFAWSSRLFRRRRRRACL